MSRGAALTGALLATLETPATWPLALATFLVRGGLVVVLVPIVVLPTPVGFGNVIAPALVSIAFGSISPELVAVSVVAACLVVAWIVVGGWLAAALEVEAAWLIALAPDIRSPASPVERSSAAESLRPVESVRLAERVRPAGRARLAARVLAARLIAFIPLAVVLAFGTVRIVLATYHELISPLDTSTPIVLRVLRATPEVIAALIITWSIGEMIGAIAARRITVAGDGVGRALRGAVATGLRHPLVTLTRFGLPTIVLLAVLIPCSVGAGSAWSAVDIALDGSSDARQCSCGRRARGGVAGRAAPHRGRRRVAGRRLDRCRGGTRGDVRGVEDRQTGDWRTDRSSATL